MRCLRFLASLVLVSSFACGQLEGVEIRTVEVRGGIYMLLGRGGNMGVCVGDQGAFLIDDQFAPLTDKIKAAIGELTEHEVQFVVNTHWHGDHTGGNENFGKGGSIIVAHENVRERMSAEQFPQGLEGVAREATAALPVVTFTDRVTFHWNDEEIRIFHVENAHTDGDAIIHFVGSNVVHMGDALFNRRYPFIDVDSGGSIDGALAAMDRVLALANDETLIIPGHGELARKKDVAEARGVLGEIRQRVAELLEADMTVDEIVEVGPTEEWDAEWGQGFIDPERFVRIVARSLTER